MDELLHFLHNSPTPYHCVLSQKEILDQAEFAELDESEDWNLIFKQNPDQKKYYVIRDDSCIAAFILPIGMNETGVQPEHPVLLLGSHTDSPGLKLRVKSDSYENKYFLQNVEIYGSPLLNTWFDRDLGLAGRVIVKDELEETTNLMIDFRSNPVAIIPSLAIHLNRDANEKNSNPLDKHKHLRAILSTKEGEKIEKIISTYAASILNKPAENIKLLGHDLFFVDTQRPALTGLDLEFLSSTRLDNLLSCFVSTMVLSQTGPSNKITMICSMDHEEVGSGSYVGAQGSFITDVIQRIHPHFLRAKSNSLMISMDNAHALHPNFKDKHDDINTPILNRGVVVKTNANQRYGTNAITQSLIQQIAMDKDINIPLQYFANRNDLSCGSTIGPIMSTQLGIPCIDLGIPTLAMHSIREMAGIKDIESSMMLLAEIIENYA